MSNEAIACVAVLAALLLLCVFLLIKKKGDGKTKEGRPLPGGTPLTERTDRDPDSPGKPGMSGGASPEINRPGGEEGANRKAGLLYIPPELAPAEEKLTRGFTDFTDDRTMTLSEAESRGGTEIRNVSGVHGINSESISDRASAAGKAAGGTGSVGGSSIIASVYTPSPNNDTTGGTVRIYQYRGGSDKWLCPFCELENPAWTSVCQVCGEIRVKQS